MYMANLSISDIAVHISPKQEFLQPGIFPHFLKWSNKNSGFLLWCLFLKAGGGGVVLNIDWSPLKKNVGIFWLLTTTNMYNNVFSQNKAILQVLMNVKCICLNTKSNSIKYISRLVNFFEATLNYQYRR